MTQESSLDKLTDNLLSLLDGMPWNKMVSPEQDKSEKALYWKHYDAGCSFYDTVKCKLGEKCCPICMEQFSGH